MSNFQTFGESIKFQENSTQEETDDNITEPFTPENFKFFSIKKIREDNLKEEIRTKTEEEESNDKEQNERGFNGKSDQEIINLFENKKEIESEAELFEDLMEEYKSIIDEYFQSVFSIDYSLNSLSLVFGKDLQTFGSKITNETRETTEFISVSEYNFIKEEISRHHKVEKLLEIIGSELFYELNSEYLYITNHALKNTDKIDYLITSENLFNDPKIKYINFRATNKKVETEKVKKAFLTFIQKFMSLIVETYQENFENRDLMLKENDINSVNLKKFALYSSKSDYFRSEDENSAEITFMPKKKIHF